jgi:hypothetical protein
LHSKLRIFFEKSGRMEDWNAGMLGYWNTGILEYWEDGILLV